MSPYRAWPLIAFLALGLANSCADTDSLYIDVAASINRGNLERAERLLDTIEGPPGLQGMRLRERIENARDERVAAAAEVKQVLTLIEELQWSDVSKRLRNLRSSLDDPEAIAFLDGTLRELNEYYVLAATGKSRPADWFTRRGLTAFADDVGEWDRDAGYWDNMRPTTSGPVAVAPGTDAVDGEPAVSESPVVAAVPIAPPPPAEPTAIDHARSARAALERGDLLAAQSSWIEAARIAVSDEDRQSFLGLAVDADDRLIFRSEVASSFAVLPSLFSEVALDAVSAKGVVIGGIAMAWKDLEVEDLLRVARPVQLSARGEIGLLQERIVRLDLDRSWRILARLVESGRVMPADAAGLLARHRGEAVPRGGYVFHKGEWRSSMVVDQEERKKRWSSLGRQLAGANPELRDQIVSTLLIEGGRAELEAAVGKRLTRITQRAARNPVLKKLTALAARRTELDVRRKAALALIFDEEEYFYPYSPPVCPPEKARLYPAVQRRVDVLVAEVREVWKDRTSVPLSTSFRTDLESLRWCQSVAFDLGIDAASDVELPDWLDGIDLQGKAVTLASFAWDAGEGRILRRSIQVRAFNRRMWALESFGENQVTATRAEQRQVEVTNDYRALFGRSALAWNPNIQAAARDHSKYMSDTGNFGHFETDPETRSPFDRMRRRDYPQGVSENCHMGGGDPEGAHIGWIHSSGHHRNILMATHREMASSVVGRYWTQNFGVGKSFQTSLEENKPE